VTQERRQMLPRWRRSPSAFTIRSHLSRLTSKLRSPGPVLWMSSWLSMQPGTKVFFMVEMLEISWVDVSMWKTIGIAPGCVHNYYRWIFDESMDWFKGNFIGNHRFSH
jgi:hypothetical protein